MNHREKRILPRFSEIPMYSICHFFISNKSVDKSGFEKSEDVLYLYYLC